MLQRVIVLVLLATLTACKQDGDTVADFECADDEYQAAASADADQPHCEALTVCGLLEYEAVPASPTSDRSCQELTICPEQTYEEIAPTATADRTCTALTTCLPGTFESVAPTATGDRVCDACLLGSGFSVSQNASRCEDTRECVPGEFVALEATLISDRECSECESGANFSTSVNASACEPVQECSESQYVAVAATATNDRGCGDCALDAAIEHGTCLTCVSAEQCSSGECIQGFRFQEGACEPVLVPVASACFSDEGTGSIECSCSEGFYGTLTWDTEALSWAGSCEPWRDCIDGEYVSAVGNAVEDRDCASCSLGENYSDSMNATACLPVTDCLPGEYVALAAEVYRDRECLPCSAGTTYSTLVNESSCIEVTQCQPGEWVAAEAQLDQNRICESCELGVSYADGTNADQCTEVSPCSDHEFEVLAPTTWSDRTCEVLTVSLSAQDTDAYEGGLVGARLELELSAAQDVDVLVYYTLGGTAFEYSDYVITSGVQVHAGLVIVDAGETSVELWVEPLATPAMETQENVEVTILPSTYFELDETKSTVNINIHEYGPSNGNVYYVSPGGDDNASGEETAPFATLAHALSGVAAGDTVYLFDGTYTNNGFTEDHGVNGNSNINHGVLASIDASGDEANWITIAAYPDGNEQRPLLRFDGSGGIEIKPGSNYIRIEGLEIEGPNKHIEYDWAHEHRWSKENFYKGRGIFTWGPVHHIVVRDCNVHHTPGSGIRFNNSDYILVEGNTVSNTTWWSSSAESGIVIATAQSIDEVEDTKILYSGNTVYNNWNFMEFCNTPLAGSTEDEYGNCDYYTGGIIDGQGLYVTRNNDTYLHGVMRFENNIAFNNGYGGVVYHKTNRGVLVNNLVFMNGAYPGVTRYSGLTVNTADELVIANNLVWAREDNDYAIKNNGNATNVLAVNNFLVGKSQFGTDEENTIIEAVDPSLIATIFTAVSDLSTIVPTREHDGTDYSPDSIDAFVLGLELDFRPLPQVQELIDAGISTFAPATDMNGRERPEGAAVDIGPFELPAD